MDLKLNFDMNLGYVTINRPLIAAGLANRVVEYDLPLLNNNNNDINFKN